MYTFIEIIKQEAISLPIGNSMSIVCPKCIEDYEEQGRPSNIWTPNKSMSISRTKQGLLYKCHRVSCGLEGFTGSLAPDNNVSNSKTFKPSIFTKDTVSLSKIQMKWFHKNFGLEMTEVLRNRFRFCPRSSSFIYPIMDRYGQSFGLVDRDYFKERKPKSISYYFEDKIKLHFPTGWDKTDKKLNYEAPIVLVEDIISSIKVTRYLPCAALLGSSLSDSVVGYLSSITDKIILSLDADAIDKALKIKNKYKTFFKEFDVIYTKQDPKDMDNDTLRFFYKRHKKI